MIPRPEDAAMRARRLLLVTAGDIGDDQREVEFQPLTEPATPIKVPTPAPAPVETPEREPVPA